MSQKIKSKIKTEAIPWLKKHWLFVMISTIFAFSQPLILGIIFLYGLVATIETEMLKAIIQAEATILGFFGFIAIYALTSVDSRKDRLEQQIFDIQIRAMKQRNDVIFENLPKRIKNIDQTKRKTVHSVVYNGVLLIGSLLASILGLGFLGIPNHEWAFYMCSLSAMLFFVGIGLILWMIYDLAQSPETT